MFLNILIFLILSLAFVNATIDNFGIDLFFYHCHFNIINYYYYIIISIIFILLLLSLYYY